MGDAADAFGPFDDLEAWLGDQLQSTIARLDLPVLVFLGTALVAWSLERQFAAGAEVALLMLSPANRSALRAYEKGGFTTELKDRPAIKFEVNLYSVGKGKKGAIQ